MIVARLKMTTAVIWISLFFIACFAPRKRVAGDSVVAPKDSRIHSVIFSKPAFPGGNAAMQTFIQKAKKYPKDFGSIGIEGKVVVGFTVSEQGSLLNIKIVKGIHDSIDEEALKVVRAMPNWLPGTEKGKPKAMDMQLAIDFYFLK